MFSRGYLRGRGLLGLRLLNQILKQGFQSSGLTPRTGAILRRLCDLGYLYQCEFYQQSLVTRLALVDVAQVHQLQCIIQEWYLTALGLFLVSLTHLVAHFE